jgi:hypothetical protein
MILATPLAEVSINHSNKNVEDITFSTHKTKIFESLIIEKIFGSKKINAAVLLLPIRWSWRVCKCSAYTY